MSEQPSPDLRLSAIGFGAVRSLDAEPPAELRQRLRDEGLVRL